MRSHRLLPELLNHYTHKAIEDSRVDEELSQSIPLLARVFDMVDEVKGEVLLHCYECLVVLNNLLLSLDISERGSYLRVVYLPILWQSQPAQFVCEPETLLSGHDCESAYLLCFGLFDPAEYLRRKHSLVVSLRKDCVFADVSKCMMGDAIAMERAEDSLIDT